MPNLITHTIFCEEVYKNISNEKYKSIIKNNRKEYLIGTNGPDYLFFHGAFPIYKKQDMTISDIGTKLHRKKINAFYKSAIKTYRAQKSGYVKDAMASYIIGHYLHWQLDSIMHPYVVYFTGFGGVNNKMYHHRFESMMDTINLKNYRNETIKTYETYKLCKRSKYSVKAISNVYIPAVKECFDIELDQDIIKQALMDWEKAQRYLYDPKKIKYRLLKFVEFITRKPGLSGNVVTPDIDIRYDVMNEEHRQWKHPCTGEISTESEDDLFQKAIENANIGLAYLFDAL
ncbi:zinc dependent phospholipase C family protein, partial [Breznakia sp. OttesenSCG-928-G09]|nr:zinc dependent phospholipase C family protein [Breznakia sp. OttesenSCG-928-G09]